MKLNAVVLSGIIIGALALGIIIGRMTDEALLDRAPKPGSVSSSNAAAPLSAFDQQRSFEEIRPADAPRAADHEPDRFKFQRLVIDPASEVPTACLEFSLPLTETGPPDETDEAQARANVAQGGDQDTGNDQAQTGRNDEAADTAARPVDRENTGDPASTKNTIYTDYIDISPSAKVAVTAIGRQLCLSGFAYSRNYDVTLKAGLPDASGEGLPRTETVRVSFGDQPPLVSFSGNGYVMPRLDSDGIGIETINVARLKVSILHINDRALVQKSLSAGESRSEKAYGTNDWGAGSASDVGVPVWEGEIEIEPRRNERMVTVFPVGAALGAARRDSLDAQGAGLKPGAYYVTIEDTSQGAHGHRPARAWRWLLFTDMALSSYRGAQGIDIVVRSLKSARPLPGTEVALIARNNEILATKTSDGDGLVRFPAAITRGTGARAPRHVMAYGGRSDFALLDLSKAGLDLSDRAIGGRQAGIQKAGSGIDPYFYTDRGIYRPGEAVHLTGLLRDAQMRAIEERPLTVTVRRPNGTIAEKIRIETLSQGGFSRMVALSRAAPRGVWSIYLTVDGIDRTQWATSFSVEDFVPQRLEVSIGEIEEAPITGPGRYPLSLSADFLYGAPGAGLQAEGEARLEVDPIPFQNYTDYSFGLHRENFTEKRLELGDTVTDGEGKAGLTLAIDSVETTGRPLRANIVAGVAEPGGRIVRDSMRVPVRLDERYIGLRRSPGEKSGDNAPVKFDAVMLNSSGDQVKSAGNVWRLFEEDYYFDWYIQNGNWRWRRVADEILVASGRINFTAGKPSSIEHRLLNGSYRLEVENPQSGAISSVGFYKGWRSYGNDANSPDQAVLTPPDYEVKPGDRARLTLDAPYEGEVYIAVATDRIHEFRRFRLTGGVQDITLSTKPEWGNGFYVLATIVTPRDAVDRPVPRRAVGVTYVPFDRSASTFGIELATPDVLRPRQKVDITGRILNAGKDEAIYMTLAAVDEGILRLTKFQPPAPEKFYFAKTELGVGLHDDYGRIINPNLAAATRFGGDSLGGEGLSVVPVKSVALFEGPVRLQEDGRIAIPVEIPDFNGSLRVMAVAWSADKVGSLAKEMIIRDPVPASLSLPGFLAPNDEASATLSIDNVDGLAGEYAVTLASEGAVEMGALERFTLDRSSRAVRAVPVRAAGVGISELGLSVIGPEFAVARTYPIEVRAPYYPVAETEVSTLLPGEEIRLDRSDSDRFLPDKLSVSASFSPLRGIDPRPLLESLAEYRHGGTEQLTATAWPLLYRNQLAGVTGGEENFDIRGQVQRAINKISARQSPDGAFGLWSAGDKRATGWIGAYTTDFLMRARAEGYKVADTALAASHGALALMTSLNRWSDISYRSRIRGGDNRDSRTEQVQWRAVAYAHYILARAGKADLSDLRYFHDTFLDRLESPLARMHLGVALAMLGDRGRAANAFSAAEKSLGYENDDNHYQSSMRDIAAMIALAGEVENTAFIERLFTALKTRMKDPDRMHTQEKVFLLLAMTTLLDRAGAVKISVDGKIEPTDEGEAGGAIIPSYRIDRARLETGVVFRNEGEGPLFASVTRRGVPIAPPAPVAAGFSLAKSFYTLDGVPVDLTEVSQNATFIVKLEGRSLDKRRHEAIIVDMLPAGFEIETVIQPSQTGEGKLYDWIGEVSAARGAQARADRFVAMLDLYPTLSATLSGRPHRDTQSFTLAYMVRAITPGRFALPGAIIEDMYRPGQFARTEVGAVQISSAR